MFREKTNESHSMATPKMSYFSDIDLATLHRTRLNERIQYKLSWFNRRQKYYIPAGNQTCHVKPIKIDSNAKSRANYNKNISTNGFNENTNTIYKNNNNIDNQKAVSSNRERTINASINHSKQNTNHYDNGNENEIYNHCDMILKRTQQNNCRNKNASSKHASTNNGVNKIEANPSLTNNMIMNNNTCVTSSCVSLPSIDLNSKKSNVVSNEDKICKSADQINQNACNKSNHTTEIPIPCDEGNTQPGAIEDDLKLPHRKRSGTWP